MALNFQLHDAPLDFIDFHGQGINLHAQAGGGFVDEIDGLVRQEPIRDVAVGKRCRRDDGGVLDAHAMMYLVAVFQSAQNRDGILDGGLLDEHRLEAALQRGIFFDVFLVFVEGGRADGAQLAPCERRLQHVRGVHRAFRRPRAHQRVQFVDEQNDLSLGFGNLF